MNEIFGWLWVLVGFLSGLALGLGFHREDWLGGYGSLRRRMVRLGHVSLVALGALNVLYAQTAPRLVLAPALASTASVALIVGAVTMPTCCGLMAWRPEFRMLFAIPVASLVLGAGIVLAGLAAS